MAWPIKPKNHFTFLRVLTQTQHSSTAKQDQDMVEIPQLLQS